MLMHSVRRLDICTLQGLPVLCSLSGKRAHVRAGQFPPDVPGGRHPLTSGALREVERRVAGSLAHVAGLSQRGPGMHAPSAFAVDG